MVHVTISERPPPQANGTDGRDGTDGTVSFELDARFDDVVDALTPDREVPSSGWLEQARRNAQLRSAFLDAVGALTAEEVAEFAGSKARNRRQTAHRWASNGDVFAVEFRGQTLYPRFQFDPVTQRPLPQVAEVLVALPPRMDGWELALWWTSEAYDPDRGTWVVPLEALQDTEQLLRLAAATHDEWRAAGAA